MKNIFLVLFFFQSNICLSEHVSNETAPIVSKKYQVISGHIPAQVKTAVLLGDVPKDKDLYLLVGLPINDLKKLDAFDKSLYDSKSPNYRKFLTPEKYGDLFGTSKEKFKKVIDFLKSHQFLINTAYKNRLGVNIKGSVTDIEKTFHVHLHYYRRPDGTEFYAPDSEPFVDLDVPILHISGLDNSNILIIESHIKSSKNR